MHVWLKIECVYLLKIIMNAGIVNSLPKNGHEELMCLLGRHEEYESLLEKTWTIMPIGQLID